MRAPVCWFVTLTYVGVDDWRKDHVSKAVERFRNWCTAQGFKARYTWVGELQKRGAVHYHLLAWLPHGVRMPHWDRAVGRRKAFWTHGMSNTEKARSGVGYLMKYLSKIGDFHVFPKGLRLYGIGGLNACARSVRSWFNLPEWVKRSYGVGDVRRLRNGFVVGATGEVVPPAYRCTLVPGGLLLEPLRDLPDKFHDGAYSTFPRTTND